MTYVYVIEELYSDFIKIGIADDVRKRFKSLQGANARPLVPRFQIPLESRNAALAVEKMVHAALAEHRLMGEWFSCPLQEAIDAIQCCAAGSQ